MTRAILTYVEADLPRCSRTYGIAPCTASIPTTGTKKCFNSAGTCQDRTNYDDVGVTVRWAQDTGNLPADIEAIPSITGVSFTPATISLGENLGQRATLTVTFKTHLDSDTGPAGDKYLADRAYDPMKQGDYWGRFRARQPFLRGRSIRLIRGELGQALADMEIRHFLVESFEGPSPDGVYTIEAKDALKMADNDRAQAPRLSNGFLVADITNSQTSATLSPSGIGDAEYPASGFIAIGGTEIVSFVRSGDALTMTRAQSGTTGVAHKAQDRCQICLVYSAQDPADIIWHLFTAYAAVPAGYIDLPAWQTETAAFLRRVYSAVIPEPTGVNTLISELVQQCAMAIWWDDIGQQLRLKVLRLIPTDADLFDRSNTMKGSLRIQEQPQKRISQVQTYFGQINPLKKVDDADNYRSSALTVDFEAEEDYGTPAIKRIFARWIAAGGRTVALRVNDIQLGRFRDPPRRFSLSLFRQEGATAPVLGQGYQIEAQPLQTDEGAPDTVPLQITRLNPGAGKFDVEAEEMRFISFDEGDLEDRVIVIDGNEYNVDFRTKHDLLYPTPAAGDEVTLIVEAGVKVGSTSTSTRALTIGTWPSVPATGNRTNASPIISSLSINTTTEGLLPGMFVRGTGITNGTKILTVDSTTQITLDANAFSTGTGGALTFYTVRLNLENRGRVQGRGGNGGQGSTSGANYANGSVGGPALYARYPFNFTDAAGQVFAGGGGGAGNSAGRDGGGGAGFNPGLGATAGAASAGITPGANGTTEAGGDGGFNPSGGSTVGGDGGGPGLAGQNTGVRTGGMAGAAIDGVSYAKTSGSPGDRRGSQIN